MSKLKIVDEIVEDITEEAPDEPAQITSSDPKWVDYVLDQLADHELIKGAPTTDGIRRVTECVFGEILQSVTDVITDTPSRITAKHTLIIQKYENQQEILVSACVDVRADKLPSPYDAHLAATACTRAEGKALRRALKIRIQTYEELSNVEDVDKTSTDAISDQQITALNHMCKRCDVDVVKFARDNISDSRKVKKITQLNKMEGRIMMDKLSGYQREGTPEELVGYDANWQTKFGA